MSKDLKIDFGSAQGSQGWRVINDGVMGGLSQGKAKLTENSILFQGNISLDNNGGFSSLKGPFQNTDLSSFENVEIKLKCKGQTFALTLETHERFFMPYFKQNLNTKSEDWEIIQLKMTDFKVYRLGQLMNKPLPMEDFKKIIRIGLINDGKKEGPFELEIDYIKFY